MKLSCSALQSLSESASVESKNLKTMRLITHNMLQSNVKGVTNGFPLLIEADKVEIVPTDFEIGNYFIISKQSCSLHRHDAIIFSLDATKNILKKINYSALKSAIANLVIASSSGITDELAGVEEITPALAEDVDFLQKIHHFLFDVHLIEGSLVCPQSGRKFPGTA